MGSNPKSNLSGNQVLQKVYDEPNDRLRVDAQIVTPPALEVAIDASTDSIAIGDGTHQLDINPDGSINVVAQVEQSGANTFEINNFLMTNALTEYSFVFPATTKRYSLQVRNGESNLHIYQNSGGSDYVTLNRGSNFNSGELKLDASFTIYFQATKPNCVLEIWYWENN